MRIRRGTVLFSLIMMSVVLVTIVNHWSSLKPHAALALNSINKPSIDSRIDASAVIVMNEQTGKILYSKNDQEKLYPASTTKIMTAWIAIEQGELQDRVTVGDEVQLRTKDESTAGLVEGQVLSLQDLLAALMLPSGNDAARTIARYIAEKSSGEAMSAEVSIEYFAKLMNQKAKKVGAKMTHFVNPHGLHSSKHYTTAKDMALIAMQAMKNDTFRQIVNKQEITTKSSSASVTYTNRNLLLQQDGPFSFNGANGIKSGFTDEAGYCLVSSASRNGKNVLAVVLHSTQDGVWTDSQKLLQQGIDAIND
ncbi:D-alanyl-D-alanine carboxypeptidase [Paenibacillus psychroresistens]|uniref:D-alanyl-D-alanine carboxypeptidase n=1 Tax=Paenibacillus psychroresistens TaxID=1778678 RepID=A0A6B8RUX8_9BACL|nr:D-alanyl-D-alanine carboxypeptidase family protein [Paenibacillus psychroresistens]QGQ99445.1 D-alanyl-D-alanine carboxypeptidase [Paenibacillus psychroresistens]